MGAGLFPAGLGSFGTDPLQQSAAQGGAGLTAITPGSAPLALAYDSSVHGFVQNADGTLQGVHPVDQQVALAIFIPLGSISAAPEIGSRFTTSPSVLSRVDPARMLSVAEDELTRCLGALIASGDVVMLGFSLDVTDLSRVILAVAYTNTRDPRYNPGNPTLGVRTLTGQT